MKLNEAERDRLLVYLTAELARARRGRGLRLNVVEATALVADAVCGAARDGTRLAVVRDPFRAGALAGAPEPEELAGDVVLEVTNTAAVPISVTSHFHFFEANPRLRFDRAAAYGMHLAVAAGAAVRFEPGGTRRVAPVPIGGRRVGHRVRRPGGRAAGRVRRPRWVTRARRSRSSWACPSTRPPRYPAAPGPLPAARCASSAFRSPLPSHDHVYLSAAGDA